MNSKLFDHLLTRREAFQAAGTALSAYWFLPLVAPSNVQAQGTASPRGTARFVIWVMLQGGQSHVDGWDLKEHKWTPQDFDIQEIQPGVKWPMALYPKLARHWERFALVRSLQAWDAVHARACYYVQSAHALNPALQKEIPALGSVIAYEFAQRRRPADILPSYVATNVTTSQVGLLKSGFLPATYSPFHVDTNAGLAALAASPEERRELQRRWDLLKSFDERLRNDSTLQNKAYRDFHNYYEGAMSMMEDPRAASVFQIDAADQERYGKNNLGNGCIIARNLVEADAGTRFVFVNHVDWDHHGRIYAQNTFYRLSRELDNALSALLDDLASRKRADGRSLLDETMVVSMGEFGRTPGEINAARGRDHHQYAYTGLFAGGGVKGGQVIGATDDLGFHVVDSGMGVKRSVYMEDVATSVYSALGIDWKKSLSGTPSGRNFYYIEPFATRGMIGAREIAPLFG
jgi:hypothetical protein